MCGDVSGTLLRRNAVTESMQRCFVVHGTDNALLEENVAFDSPGHCYMLEDGAETGNRVRVLRASPRLFWTAYSRGRVLVPPSPTHTRTHTCAQPGPSVAVCAQHRHGGIRGGRAHLRGGDGRIQRACLDHSRLRDGMPCPRRDALTRPLALPLLAPSLQPAVFWISNPDNEFVGNVAAGSEDSGFFFELRAHVRGPSQALHPDIQPQSTPFRRFEDNAAHACKFGFKTYPNSLVRPTVESTVLNFRAWSNYRAWAVKRSERLALVGGVIANSRLAGIRLRNPDAIRIQGVTVIGALPGQCPNYGLSGQAQGVELHQFEMENDEGHTGMQLIDVTFERFGESETGCPRLVAFGFRKLESTTGFPDVRLFVQGLRFVSSASPQSRVSFCNEEDLDTTLDAQLAIKDADGSLLPDLTAGSPAHLVSDNGFTRSVPGCTPVAGTCGLVCPGVCFRLAKILTPRSFAADTALRLTAPGRGVVDLPGFSRDDTSLYRRRRNDKQRRFYALVPAADAVVASFVDARGERVWPAYPPEVVAEDDHPGACGALPVVDFGAVPGADCGTLVHNGGVETGDVDGADWSHHGGGLELSADSYRGAFALESGGDVGQWLDLRCWRRSSVLRVGARVKLPRRDRVEFFLRISRTDGSTDYVDFAARSGVDAGAWELVDGTLDLTDRLVAGARSVYLSVRGPEGMLIDEAAASVCGEVVAHASEAMPLVWQAAGRETVSIVDGTTEPTSPVLMASGRTASWQGAVQRLYPGCLAPGDEVRVRARVRLESGSQCAESGGAHGCVVCERRLVDTAGGDFVSRRAPCGRQTSFEEGTWHSVDAVFTVDAAEVDEGRRWDVAFSGPPGGERFWVAVDSVALVA